MTVFGLISTLFHCGYIMNSQRQFTETQGVDIGSPPVSFCLHSLHHKFSHASRKLGDQSLEKTLTIT